MEEFEFDEEKDIDESILKLIKDKYLSVIQITDILKVNKNRVSTRIKLLRKHNEVIFRPVAEYKKRGIKPLEYKKC